MAYSKHTWEDGEVITAAKLNNIEDGCGNSGVMTAGVTTSGQESSYYPIFYDTSLNKTFKEIYDALSEGTPIYVRAVTGTTTDYTAAAMIGHVAMAFKYDNTYRVYVETPVFRFGSMGGMGAHNAVPSVIIFSASSASSYPVAIGAVSFNSSVNTDTWD